MGTHDADVVHVPWTQPERPKWAVMESYGLAAKFAPFSSILEIGTKRRLAESLLAPCGELETTAEHVLGTGKTLSDSFELVIALHVLEHCTSPLGAAEDLWSLSGAYLLIEVPAIEVELPEQGFDDINPGHVHHFSMASLLDLLGGRVMGAEAVRHGAWPCNRVFLKRQTSNPLEDKRIAADAIYERVAWRIASIARDGDAYLGQGYSLGRLLALGAPVMPSFDTYKSPVPPGFSGRLILTPRYLPTRMEMIEQYGAGRCIDPWKQ